MTFSQKFDDYVCIGDTITCTVDGYTVTARIAHDETPDAPDERQDGFWPSLYKDDAGFIGAGNGWRDRFDKAQAKAERVMAPQDDSEPMDYISVKLDGPEMNKPINAALFDREDGADLVWSRPKSQ